MYICPVSGCRLIRARVKGGHFWYSPESDGRLMTLSTFKHYLGADAGNEIWMRSSTNTKSQYNCPGCLKKMNKVTEPTWVGAYHVDVCRRCWMVWMDQEDHPEIPRGSDISEHVEKIKINVARTEAAAIGGLQKAPTAEPDHFIHYLPGAFLPTKTNLKAFPFHTLFFIILAIGFHDQLIFGGGFGLIYFALNLYFFYLFSSDLEIELNPFQYYSSLLFIFSTGRIFNFIFPFQIAYIDITTVNISFMIMAIFLPLNARFSYLFPAVHYFHIPNISFIGRMKGLRWISVPQFVVILLYMAIIIPWYLHLSAVYPQIRLLYLSQVILGMILGLVFAKSEA